jgi:hypothetical protein
VRRQFVDVPADNLVITEVPRDDDVGVTRLPIIP